MLTGAKKVPYERLPEPLDDFEEQRCETKISGYATQCGWVTVPESPGSPRTVELFVLRVFSDAPAPEADPIVYLDGGPGSPGTSTVVGMFESFEPLLDNRDLVAIDQRGTGRSTPSLACTEIEEVTTRAQVALGLGQCFERLSAEVDLGSYDTAHAARDVDAVRRALGYESWNLYGISYGTRLGLTVLRDHPEGVRAAVLDSVVPLEVDLLSSVAPNGHAALERVFSACVDDVDCGDAHPGGMPQLLSLVARLDAQPLDVKTKGGTHPLTGEELTELLFTLMYAPEGVAVLPALVDMVDEGDGARLGPLVDAMFDSGSGDMLGPHVAVQCAEEAPFTTPEAMESALASVPPELHVGLGAAYYFDYCDAFRVPSADAVENEPVVSDVPTLLVAGGFDPITPPAYAELVHGSLEGSTFVTLQGGSHGSSAMDCAPSFVSAFFDDPTGEVSLGRCGAELTLPPTFLSTKRGRAVRDDGKIAFRDAPEPDELADIARAARRRRALR